MQKILLLIALFTSSQINAICNRLDRKHSDPNIVRCMYNQEDIYRCYSKKLHCYGTAERCKECFFCGCPIGEHTATQKKKQPGKSLTNKK